MHLAAIPMVLLVVAWLIGIGFFRQSAPPKVPRTPVSKAPTVLNTAADYLARGDYDFDLGNYDQALAAYSRAIELQPDFAEAYNNRAYTYMKLEKYELALPDLDQAIRLRPNYVNALINRGDIHNYYYQINPDLAISDYDQALDLADDAIAEGHRAMAFMHKGDPGPLLNSFLRAIKSDFTGVRPER